MKFAKVTNDKDKAVEVTYTNADGKEAKTTVEPGPELEVPAEAEGAVKSQVADSTAPEADVTDTTGDADETATGDDAATPTAGGAADDDAKELSRLRLEKATWNAQKQYSALLTKGKILPAQKHLFMAFCKDAATSGF